MRILFRSCRAPLLCVFLVAFALRLIYLFDYRSAPFFDNPVGDSSAYHERALEILDGDLLGQDVDFLSGALYPYFLAAVYRVCGVNLLVVRLLQALIGSLTCVLIYMLARTLTEGRRGPPLAAGLAASFYGTLVYFDGDILMTTLELVFLTASLLLLLRLGGPDTDDATSGGHRQRVVAALAAGTLLGLAGLGRANVLLFVPLAVLWIFTRFRSELVVRRWRYALLFTIGCAAALLPNTIRNYHISGDFVPVTSSAGVNLYIGNNPDADGGFVLPPGSGLRTPGLYASSREVATAATGNAEITPSAVSRYWFTRAVRFVTKHPREAGRLFAKKFLLFWNRYEIPNHHNRYFVTTAYAPLLGLAFLGFGMVAPLAVIGALLLLLTRRPSPQTRLCATFVVVYMLSVLPFFVTSRYRTPVVPLLIVFAAMGVWELIRIVRKRQFRWMITACVVIATVAFLAHRPIIEANFWLDHAIAGTAHSNLAMSHPDQGRHHLETAIVELKKAIELAPEISDPHYNLGVAYERLGFFTGAVREYQATLMLAPEHPFARGTLAAAQVALADAGDAVPSQSIPMTTFEIAQQLAGRGMFEHAARQFERVFEEDPQHAWAYNELGAMHMSRQDFAGALTAYLSGLRHIPNSLVLHSNAAGAYYRLQEYDGARRHWERCLEIDPDNEDVRRQMSLLPVP